MTMKKWLKLKDLTAYRFAADLGIPTSTVYGWLNNGTEPSHMARSLIATRYPDCPLLAQKVPQK